MYSVAQRKDFRFYTESGRNGKLRPGEWHALIYEDEDLGGCYIAETGGRKKEAEQEEQQGTAY